MPKEGGRYLNKFVQGILWLREVDNTRLSGQVDISEYNLGCSEGKITKGYIGMNRVGGLHGADDSCRF